MSRIVLNETSYFEAGCRNNIAQELTEKNFKKAFIATDKDLIKFGVTKLVTDVLEKINFPYCIFDEIKPNPTIENCQKGLQLFIEENADVIIAIGGGSVIDTAKAIGITFTNPEFRDIVSLEGVAPTKNRSIPIIAFPTTAGTAAEVTINYVITDESTKRKMVCVDPKDIPILAIVDAELMYSMPKELTAATGMDALTHAIEGYITKGAWTMTNMFALNAIALISENLKQAVDNGKDKEAKENMALASYIAGMGFSNVGLGIVHSMAHPLGAVYDIPHGVANALLLPYVMEYNKSSSKSKYADIAEAMGVNTKMMPEEVAADEAIKAVRELSISIGIPQKLNELGVKEEDLLKLANDAFNDPCTPGNPKDTNINEILEIYKKAL
jgi:lactaldehyde reductase